MWAIAQLRYSAPMRLPRMQEIAKAPRGGAVDSNCETTPSQVFEVPKARHHFSLGLGPVAQAVCVGGLAPQWISAM